MMDHELKQLVEFLISKGRVNLSEIEHRFGMTRRQVEYRLDKLNTMIQAESPTDILLVQTNGGIIVTKTIRNILCDFLMDIHQTYIYSAMERQAYIFMGLLGHQAEVGIVDFMLNLGISKSTFLNDLKVLRKFVLSYGVKIENSKNRGYYLSGPEEMIRFLCMYYVNQITLNSLSEGIFEKILQDFDLILISQESMEEMLKYYQVRYVANRLTQFHFILNLLLHRMLSYPQVSTHYEEKLMQTMRSLKEYQLAYRLTRDFEVTEGDLAYISAWLVSISITSVVDDHVDRPIISSLVQTFINRFLVISGLDGSSTKELFDHVYAHFRAAYYRILFNIPIGNPYLEKIKTEYPELILFVEQALKPVEAEMEHKFDGDELAYLALHFAGIYSDYEPEMSPKHAVIVCDNGIGISTMMFNELSKLFEYIDFYAPMSYADFLQFNKPYDMVFTNHPSLDAEIDSIPIYKLDPILTDIDKHQLKARVNIGVGESSDIMDKVEVLIKLVEQHSLIQNKAGLKTAFLDYYLADVLQPNIQGHKGDLRLIDMLSPNLIYLRHKARNWQEAVAKAAQLLVDEGYVDPSYFMQLIVADNVSRFVIMPQVALPHAAPDFGVKRYGLSVVTLENPVSFGETPNNQVSLILCLAAKKERQHLGAMKELIELLQDPYFVQSLANYDSREQLYTALKSYLVNSS